MKKLFSTFSVALGLLALASCSQEDDFTQKKASLQNVGEGDLIVTVDDFENESGAKTRSFLSRDMQTRYYVVSDELKVYDNDLHKYDIFKFNWKDDSKAAGVFRRSNTTSNITEAKWALYPKADVLSGNWEYNETTDNSETTVVMDVPAVMEYDGTYDVNDKEFETPLYKDVLPRWGQVESTADGAALQTNLSYMTGILRLQLAGIPDYAKAVRIQMLEGGLAANPVTMAGSFSTIIAKNDVKQTDAALAAEKNVAPSLVSNGEAIYIDLRTMGAEGAPLKDIDAAKAVVYVPLVTTTKAVDIVVSICNDPTVVDVTDDTDFSGSTATYTEYSRFKNKVIKKGKVYGNSKEYNLALEADGPEAISDALELEEVAEGEDLILNITGSVDVCDPDNTILIPNKKAASITIDLTQAEISTSCGSDLYVKYKDATGEGKYAGKVIVKTADNSVTNPVEMVVDLDSTPFQMTGKGDIKKLKLVDATALTIDGSGNDIQYTLSNNVKTLTVNSGATSADITIDKNSLTAANVENIYVYGTIGNITNANNAATNVFIDAETWQPAAQAGVINVGGNVTMTKNSKTTGTITAGGAVTMSGKAVSGGAITANGDVTISEDANGSAGDIISHGNISVQHNTWTAAITYPLLQTDLYNWGGNVSISGNTIATTVQSNADFSVSEEASAATVTLKGNATVNASKELESITTSISFANNANLNLTQGYIKKVITNNKTIKLYHGENAGFTAIAEVDKENKLVAQNVSKWNGKQIGTSFASAYALDNGKRAWTATQVGQQLTSAASFQLRSNIDLDNKDWKGINATAAYEIDGNGKTISNINLVGNDKTSSTMAGFIYKAAAAVSANDLTLNGVKTTIKAVDGGKLVGVGGFVGDAEATATLERVSIKLATGYFGSMDGTKNIKSWGIGGAIGIANGAVTLKGATVDATGAILSGYCGIGGFIGAAYNTVDILTDPELGDRPETACAVTGLSNIWITQLNLDTYDNDPNQGKTGAYIGTANLAKAITIQDAADVKPTFTVGGKANEAKAFNVVSNKMQLFSRADQTLIGQSGFDLATANPKINGKTYCIKKTGESFIDGSGILYNVTVTAYH